MKIQTQKGKVFKQAHETFIRSGRSYVGSVSVLEDAELSCQSRILFHIISSLSYIEGFCFATNETLAIRLGLKKTMVKQYLKELELSNLIESKTTTCSYGKRREIYIEFDMLQARYRNA
ncbi:MAG: hypothetical protein EOO43_05615 [Flavobacterium sp.]|nr:MAG: hypothetical protein EOO43_05615 [Flavobacterium sp.]